MINISTLKRAVVMTAASAFAVTGVVAASANMMNDNNNRSMHFSNESESSMESMNESGSSMHLNKDACVGKGQATKGCITNIRLLCKKQYPARGKDFARCFTRGIRGAQQESSSSVSSTSGSLLSAVHEVEQKIEKKTGLTGITWNEPMGTLQSKVKLSGTGTTGDNTAFSINCTISFSPITMKCSIDYSL